MRSNLARGHGIVGGSSPAPSPGAHQRTTKIGFPPLDWLLMGGMMALSGALDLYHLGTTSVWYDEAWSFQLADQSLHVMRLYIWGLFQNMALYYLLLHYWLHATLLIGLRPTEVVLRLPTVVLAVLSAATAFALGTRFWGRTAGIVGALLYVLNFQQLYAAQQARAYSLQLLLICVGWYAFFAALAAESRRAQTKWWIAYTLAMALAIYAQLFSALVLASQVVAFAGLLVLPGSLRNRARATWKRVVLSVLAVTVLCIPIIFDAAINGGESLWIGAAGFADLYFGLILPFAGHSVIFLCLLGIACVLAVLGAAGAPWPVPALLLRARPPSRTLRDDLGPPMLRQPQPGVFVLLCWLVVPVCLSFAATQPGFNHHLFNQRYLVVIVPPMCLLAAIGVSVLRPRRLQAACAVVLVGVALLTVPRYYATAQVQDFRSTTLWIERQYQPGDGLACYPDLLCVVPVDYYLQAYPRAAHFDGNSPGWWSWQYYYPIDADVKQLAAYATQHHRIFLIDGPIPGPVGTEARYSAMRAWLRAHGHLLARESASAVTVELYEVDSAPSTGPNALPLQGG